MGRTRCFVSLVLLALFTAVAIVIVVALVARDDGHDVAAGEQPTVAAERPPTGAVAAPSGEPMPVGDLPGWHQIFTDDFNTPVPLGSFPTAVSSKWAVYPSPWRDTSRFGTNSPLQVDSIANGMLTQHLHTAGGVTMVSAIQPKLHPAGPYGITYGRYAVRFRAARVAGFKVAWLLWPDSEDQPRDGEIDFPEANLDAPAVRAFVHHTRNLGGDDQASFTRATVLSDWHTAVIEWSPNLVVFTLDGVETGRTTQRVPSTPMHWVLQTETAMTITAPPASAAAGNIDIDWVAAWAYDPSTRAPPRSQRPSPPL